jgi:hypothetical protein
MEAVRAATEEEEDMGAVEVVRVAAEEGKEEMSYWNG